MRLMLAENGLSQMGPPPFQGLTPLEKATRIINSAQAIKSIPFVSEALLVANGIFAVFTAREKAAFEKTLVEARGEPVKWWASEGKSGSPWEPMTQEKAAWLVERLGAAVQTVSQQLIGLKAGEGKVSKARWVKAYQTLLDEVIASQKKVTAGPGLVPGGYTKFLPYLLGGAALLFFFFRRKK